MCLCEKSHIPNVIVSKNVIFPYPGINNNDNNNIVTKKSNNGLNSSKLKIS